MYMIHKYLQHTGFFKKEQPTNLNSSEELDTPGPPISMLCESSAWWSLQKKTAILAPAIEKWW